MGIESCLGYRDSLISALCERRVGSIGNGRLSRHGALRHNQESGKGPLLLTSGLSANLIFPDFEAARE